MRALLLGALLTLGACQPDIGSGVYYCGPERACPPELRCDDATAICVFPDMAEPFLCGDGGNSTEPDDDRAVPYEVGTAGCGALTVNQNGCIDELDDLDHLAMEMPASCDGGLEVDIRYPVAFAPITLDLLDEDGAVLGAGELCDDLDEFGDARVCATATVSPGERVVIRIGAVDGGPDCDGTCGYNRYQLSIF